MEYFFNAITLKKVSETLTININQFISIIVSITYK